MIKSITVTNYLGESKKYELSRPELSGLVITNIEGLGPVKSDILTTKISSSDGSSFNSARTGTRNVIIYFDFRFAKNIEVVRHETYKYFPKKKKIKLLIETDTRICETYGYVEDNDPNIFSENETTQISIICPDPYFYSVETNKTMLAGIEPMFEFPFSNESLDDDLIVFSEIRNRNQANIIYEGDADIGMIIRIVALGEASDIIIYNLNTREQIHIDTSKLKTLTGSGIIYGDEIIISTVKGNKYIKLLRNAVYTNIFNCIDKDTDWFQLTKGDNKFSFVAVTGQDNLELTMENQVVYEGV